jgi:hypothetical protein
MTFCGKCGTKYNEPAVVNVTPEQLASGAVARKAKTPLLVIAGVLLGALLTVGILFLFTDAFGGGGSSGTAGGGRDRDREDNDSGNTNFAADIIGEWQRDSGVWEFRSGGTGETAWVREHGRTRESNFSWSISGEQLTINNIEFNEEVTGQEYLEFYGAESFTYTIDSLTSEALVLAKENGEQLVFSRRAANENEPPSDGHSSEPPNHDPPQDQPGADLSAFTTLTTINTDTRNPDENGYTRIDLAGENASGGGFDLSRVRGIRFTFSGYGSGCLITDYCDGCASVVVQHQANTWEQVDFCVNHTSVMAFDLGGYGNLGDWLAVNFATFSDDFTADVLIEVVGV